MMWSNSQIKKWRNIELLMKLLQKIDDKNVVKENDLQIDWLWLPSC